MAEHADSESVATASPAPAGVSSGQHSPLPWRVKRIEYGHAILMGPDAARTYPREFAVDEVIEWEHDCRGVQGSIAKGNAEFIVRCVNSHDDLLAALRKSVEAIRALHGIGMPPATEAEVWRLYQQSPEMKAINAALAKAEGR